MTCNNNASPRDISSGMLRRPPVNLNKQSQDATILLIREVLQRGIELTEVAIQLWCLTFVF
jgi:ribonuclease H2 subunit A